MPPHAAPPGLQTAVNPSQLPTTNLLNHIMVRVTHKATFLKGGWWLFAGEESQAVVVKYLYAMS